MPTGPSPTGREPFLAEQFDRQIQLGNVAQDALAELHVAQVADVSGQRHFVVGTAVQIFEQEVRQARSGERPIIADVRRSLIQT